MELAAEGIHVYLSLEANILTQIAPLAQGSLSTQEIKVQAKSAVASLAPRVHVPSPSKSQRVIVTTSQLCHDVWLINLLRKGELLLRLRKLDLDWRKVLIVFTVLFVIAAILLLYF